ncbi:hypothetical protein VVMO6_01843 [Vibrio vulnificus MO6-24/O]|nr:hypothetical protein VVMO6_01843 [Vibrio vulnificus MO6-24/O]
MERKNMEYSQQYHDELEQDCREWLIDKPFELPPQPTEF